MDVSRLRDCDETAGHEIIQIGGLNYVISQGDTNERMDHFENWRMYHEK